MENRNLFISVVMMIILGLSGCVKANEEAIFNDAKKLQEALKTSEAVVKYEELINSYPKGTYASKAQFMVGFLYANDLKDYPKAKKAYEDFLKNYSTVADSGMVVSAKWELKYLGKDINEIDELKSLAPEDTTVLKK